MRIYKWVAIVVLLLTGVEVHGAENAEQIMQKASATVSGSVNVSFRLSGAYESAGQIAVSGKKFYLNTGSSKIWYDGKEMTTLNLATNEATVTEPTQADVNATCPLSYIQSWSQDYSVKLAERQPSSGYCLILTSKSVSAAAKKGVLTLHASNFQPKKLVISLKSGKMVTLTVTSIRKGIPSAANGFRFPRTQYPKVKIIDLR